MQDKFLQYIAPIFLFPIFIVGLILLHLVSILLYPLFRIPIGEKVTFELKIRFKAIDIGDIFREPIENYTRNVKVSFESNESSQPHWLYMPLKEINKLPKEVYDPMHMFKYTEQNQTVVAVVETKKLRFFNAYLPAKLVSYKLIDEKPILWK